MKLRAYRVARRKNIAKPEAGAPKGHPDQSEIPTLWDATAEQYAQWEKLWSGRLKPSQTSGRVGETTLAAFAVLYLHQRSQPNKPLQSYRRPGLAKRMANWASPHLQSVIADRIDERAVDELIKVAIEIEKLPAPKSGPR
jgi:hypothetical protein